MPLVKRAVSPVNISQVDVPNDIENDLEYIFNASLCNLIRQLASLSIQANDMFNDLGSEVTSIAQRTQRLQNRLGKMQITMDNVIRQTLEQNIDTTQMNVVDPFASRSESKLQAVDRTTIPNCVVVVYKHCEPPPPLHIMNRFRQDGKDSAKLYSDPTFFFELWRKEMLEAQPKPKKVNRNPSKHKGGRRPRQKGGKQAQIGGAGPVIGGGDDDGNANAMGQNLAVPNNNYQRQAGGGNAGGGQYQPMSNNYRDSGESTPSGSINCQSPMGLNESPSGTSTMNSDGGAMPRYPYAPPPPDMMPPSPSQLPPPADIKPIVGEYIFDDQSPYAVGLGGLEPPPNFGSHQQQQQSGLYELPPPPPSLPSSIPIPPPLPEEVIKPPSAGIPPPPGLNLNKLPPAKPPATIAVPSIKTDLMASIRQGINLRPVDDTRPKEAPPGPPDTVQKIMEEVEKRRNFLKPNDSEDDNSDWSSD